MYFLEFKFIVTHRRYLFYFIMLGWSSNVNFSLSFINRTSDLHSARMFCNPMADSCQCMAKPTQYCKVRKIKIKKKRIFWAQVLSFYSYLARGWIWHTSDECNVIWGFLASFFPQYGFSTYLPFFIFFFFFFPTCIFSVGFRTATAIWRPLQINIGIEVCTLLKKKKKENIMGPICISELYNITAGLFVS